MEDTSCVYEDDVNFFDLFRDGGNINTIFSAKDHKNNYGGSLKGVDL